LRGVEDVQPGSLSNQFRTPGVIGSVQSHRVSSCRWAKLPGVRLAAAGAGDYRQAVVALTIKGYLVPLTREEQMQLGDLYAVIDVPEEASHRYETAMSDNASTKELERLASAYLAAHDSQAALCTLDRALAMDPTPRLWSLYGDLHFMEKNYEDAYRVYEKSSNMDGAEGRAFLMMAYRAIELGNKDDAKAQLQKAAGYPNQESKALDILGKIDEIMQ
jgi:tetratricopeptide (TPR) repeat protein